jgi:lysophospholipid acyltransferase (LPLAT)-like uncharacterized protein
VSTQSKLKGGLRWVRRQPAYAQRETVLLGLLVWGVLWLLRRTTRLQLEGADPLFARWRAGEPTVLAFWHGRSIMLPFLLPGRPRPSRRAAQANDGYIAETMIMNSTHRDGEIITRALARFGVTIARGSSTRGAVGGTLALMRGLARGAIVALIPDGPRGPAGEAKAGAVELAASSGALLFPVSASASRSRRMTGWDRMMIPLPGARVTCVVGEPFTFPAGRLDKTAREQARALLESRLSEVTRQADRSCGRDEEAT